MSPDSPGGPSSSRESRTRASPSTGRPRRTAQGTTSSRRCSQATYDVYEVVWPDWQPTTTQPVHISVAGSMVYFEIRVDLGNIRYATVYGYKFLDTYQNVYPYWPNGNFDEGEDGIGNWEITLQGRTNTGVLVDRVVYTDNYFDIGHYEFGELLPGTYWVNETMMEHFYATRPISNMIAIYPFPYGQVSMRIDFGNLLPEVDPELNFVLKKGVNLWSSPLEITGGLMASDLAAAIGPTAMRISMYDTATKTYKDFLPLFNDADGPEDFPILVGVGYFVVVSVDTAFVLEGDLATNAVVSLAGGINILGYTELTVDVGERAREQHHRCQGLQDLVLRPGREGLQVVPARIQHTWLGRRLHRDPGKGVLRGDQCAGDGVHRARRGSMRTNLFATGGVFCSRLKQTSYLDDTNRDTHGRQGVHRMKDRSISQFRSVLVLSATAALIALVLFSVVSVPASAGPANLVVYGYVTDSNGDPVEGADVLVENLDTVCSPLTDTTDSLGRYQVSFDLAYWQIGDTLRTTVTFGGNEESATGVADEFATLQIDVQFTLAIPEFGSLTGVLVTMGIIGIIATVSMRRKKA